MEVGSKNVHTSKRARSHTSFARKYAEKERAGNGMFDGPTGKEQEMWRTRRVVGALDSKIREEERRREDSLRRRLRMTSLVNPFPFQR